MKIDQENFAQLVNKAMQVENVSHMRSVIEKELLHYDILFALEKGGLLGKLRTSPAIWVSSEVLSGSPDF
ncbi:hypothetical protein BC355_14085 [Vibrio cholerae]|uniref:Uncharacterized protein n=1 Tax=Vibrio cholerae TaxID=666 RepID=A0A395U807_VIBCL|nr:hypothetical protein [Vibrio cholerae]RGP83418.1 hypothetical protein BC354_17495 [Vibrio cholerae]RGP86166.1 hypothetical protein BC355_14085 [Vibrio cholerae]RGP86508.1 hypothetical protein BC353_14065 [Vibrio cholerae]RGP93280.1 hypothetical protein BC352_16905 [Vibrio cholerae]